MKIYLIGSLTNPEIPGIANDLEEAGHIVFADWYSPGPEADIYWQRYEERRGRDFFKAMKGPHPRQVFEFDRKWLNWAEAGVMAMPAGRSGHLELGYLAGIGTPGFILFPEAPKKWDIMYGFASGLSQSVPELLEQLGPPTVEVPAPGSTSTLQDQLMPLPPHERSLAVREVERIRRGL